MRHLLLSLGLVVCLGTVATTCAQAAITAAQQGQQVTVAADHFRLTIDGARGGQITNIQLFDGAQWNTLLGGDGQTCPAVAIRDPAAEFRLERATAAKIEKLETTPELVRLETTAAPRAADGRPSPWTVRLAYEIYAEGAVFVDLRLTLPQGATTVADATLTLAADRAVVDAAKYRQQTYVPEKLAKFDGRGLPSARLAFGVNPECSYTNEVQAIVEVNKALRGAPQCRVEPGRFVWQLVEGPTEIKGPFVYENRFSLGLGAAATGKPRTNLIAQRVYHWINWVQRKEVAGAAWYPSDELIDKMAANHATLLVLHEHWMDEEGNNGRPHANYRPRDEQAFLRTLRHAHAKGLRVGVYSRGIERYAPAVGFFEKYLQRDWDGLYVDWSGPHAIAQHENSYQPDAALGDAHVSRDGSVLPAREFFLYTKRLRQLVGPRGFLIAHQGFGATGCLANLAVDAYLPGESGHDHRMFTSRDNAVFGGMLGSCECMPWTIDAPGYISPEGVAKMAVWGFYPHAGLGFQRPTRGKQPPRTLFPADPNSPTNAFVLPYWRVLATVDAERCTEYNSPAVNRIAARSSTPAIACQVYKQAGASPAAEAYLVIAANLGDKPAAATITLQPKVLGLSGDYQAVRINAQTGAASPLGVVTDRVATSTLAPWQIEGVKLTKSAVMP